MLSIVYDPQHGRPCPDGQVDSLAAGAVANAKAFGDSRIVTGTGVVVDAIVDAAIRGEIPLGELELHAYGLTWKLTPYGRWLLDGSDGRYEDFLESHQISTGIEDWPIRLDYSERKLKFACATRFGEKSK